MPSDQKALVVMARPGSVHGLDELNIALGRGWRVAHVAPMGGAGVNTEPDAEIHFAALVILERSGDAEAAVLAAVEEEADDAVGEIVRELGMTEEE